MKTLKSFSLLFAACAAAQLASAQSTWNGAGTDQNWSTAGNWTGVVPASDPVTFPDGAFPITTNVLGAVNNIVSANTTITTLTFNNNGAANDFDTTLIPGGITLTAAGNVTIGNAAIAVAANFVGGGSLLAGTGTSTLAVQSTSGTATLDLSKLTNFVFNSGGAGSTISLSTGSSSATGKINLAAGSNNITATTLSLGNNNTGGTGTMNLGNGTNIINADTISIGIDKTTGLMQFLNNAAGGLSIANHTGTGRATITLGGTSSSGSTGSSDNGSMLFNGGTVNILAGTLILGSRAARTGAGSANGVLSFNSGLVDATTINMAVNTSGSAANGTLSVGGGTLKIGTGSLSMANQAGTAGTSALIVTNGGSVICSNNIYKLTSKGTATITISGGSLNMASLFGTIGVSNGVPIDNFNVTNGVLTLPVIGSSADVVVTTFNPDVTNTINIGSLPSISSYPSQFPIIGYTAPSGGNLATLALGAIPSGFAGYISNNIANSSIDLVLTSGPAAKADLWQGTFNGVWDTTTRNWVNNGFATNYLDLDFVTFDDTALTGNVSLTTTRKPGTLTFNNNSLNYIFTGAGKISGAVQLVMNGSAAVTLAETGGDNFNLGIAANAGTLVLDDTNSSISGGLTIGGGATVQIGNNDASGSLPAGPLDDEGTLIFDQTNNTTLATLIRGGGALTQSGSGTLTLSAANTYSGATTVTRGTLALTGSGAIASSASVTVSNATLDVSGVSASNVLNSVTLAGATLNVKLGYLQTNFIAANLTLGGISNVINVRSLPAIAYYPATNALIYASGGISGYNFVLGTLPAGSPAYAGSLAESADQTSVLLILTNGPIGVRPSVAWSGNDAFNNVSTNWTDAQNWLTPGVPVAAEKVSFTDAGATGGSPFDVTGDGVGGIVNPVFINNIVNASLTNAALSYANDSSGEQNTLIAAGQVLTVNGPFTVSGAGGTVTILGTNGTLQINNPGSASAFNVENGTAPTLDMSGLGTFIASVTQLGIGYSTASAGSHENGTWYLARTNIITAGPGNFGTASSLVVGGSTGSAGGNGLVYLGQTNALYLDGIVLGASTSTSDQIIYNPVFTNNLGTFIRGISGAASRVTTWSLGDDTVNLNNAASGNGYLNDFTAGSLNALVSTLKVGQGAHGNTVNGQINGTFNMGLGRLDVTTLEIGVGGIGAGGTGLGVMNVYGGTVVVNSLGLGVVGDGGGIATTAGSLNLSNATLVVSNGITLGTGTAGGTLNCMSDSTVKILNGTIGSPSAPLTTLDLDGGILQLAVNDTLATTNIVATTVTTTANPTTIDISAIAGVSGTVQIPLISYTGTDPYPALTLGTYPSGYTAALVDDTVNSSIDLSVASTVKSVPHFTHVSVSGATLTMNATNGTSGGQFVLLSTTNLTRPLSQWSPVLTNNFDGSGNLNLSTNIINPAVPQQFYLLSQ